MRRSSYRLGRRLKSSAKARLDYITYLQSGAGKGKGRVPDAPGHIRVRFAGGGEFSINAALPLTLGAIFAAGGELVANTRTPVAATVNFAGEGALNTPVRIVQQVKANFDAGGEMRAHVYPPHRLAMTFEAEGAISAKALIIQRLKAVFEAGGEFAVNAKVTPAVKLAAVFAAGGTFTAGVAEPIPPVLLGAKIAGGGELTVGVAEPIVDVTVDMLVGAMNVEPTEARKTKMQTLLDALKSSGVFAQLDCLYIFHAHDAQAARVNWINPNTFEAREIGTPSFVVNNGYAGVPATNSVLASGWVAATHARKWATGDACMFYYATETNNNTAFDMGVYPSAGIGVAFLTGNHGNPPNAARGSIDNAGRIAGGVVDTAAGIRAINRITLETQQLVQSTGVVAPAASVAEDNMPTIELAMCGHTTNPDTYTATARRHRAAGWGRALTSVQFAALQSAIAAYIAP